MTADNCITEKETAFGYWWPPIIQTRTILRAASSTSSPRTANASGATLRQGLWRHSFSPARMTDGGVVGVACAAGSAMVRAIGVIANRVVN